MQLTRLAVFSLAAFLSFTNASPLPDSDPYSAAKRQVDQHQKQPSKRGPGGWNRVQYPTGAAEASIPIQNGALELFAMSKAGQDFTQLKRIVFVIHGEGRDPWNYYSHMTQALHHAHKVGVVTDISEIGIWAPGFWDQQDYGAWPKSERHSSSGNNNQLVWHNDDWADGAQSVFPANITSISSYDAIDDAIIYFGDKTVFPNVETIVLAGHSEGAQMLHRYAHLSNHPVVEPEVHYYIGNPASWLYLDDRRPEKGIGGATSRNKCNGYNDYKFGLNNIDTLLAYNSPYPSSDVIFERYSLQYVHYQLGTKDFLSMSNLCGSHVQGSQHFNRGRIYQAYLELLGYPALHTIDYIVGIGHNDYQMFSSPQGMFRLFIENNSQGKTMASSTDKTHGLNVVFTGISSSADQNMPGQSTLV